MKKFFIITIVTLCAVSVISTFTACQNKATKMPTKTTEQDCKDNDCKQEDTQQPNQPNYKFTLPDEKMPFPIQQPYKNGEFPRNRGFHIPPKMPKIITNE